jgi:hypothetical protein
MAGANRTNSELLGPLSTRIQRRPIMWPSSFVVFSRAWRGIVDSQKGSSPSKHAPFWPLWVALGFPLLLIALEASPIAPNFFFVVMGVPTLLLVWSGLGVWALFITGQWLRNGSWLRAVTSAVLPLAVLFVGFHLSAFVRCCNNAGDVVHFLVVRPTYVEAVRATPPNGQPRLMVFNLGGMSWSSRGFVYDESDEVLREPSLQSSGWKDRSQNTELSCGYYAQPFPGHFAFTQHWYLASFPC